jgi:hypothetical protein
MSDDIIKQLKAVLDQVDDVPALINSLPHDLLRKIILLVGMQDYVFLHGVRHHIDSLIYALENDAQTYDDAIVAILQCDHCYHVELTGDGRSCTRMKWCNCKHDKYICNDCIDEHNMDLRCADCYKHAHAS